MKISPDLKARIMSLVRRIELAEKKSRGELNDTETAEFYQLQTAYFDCLIAKYPMTPTDLKRLAEIEKRLNERKDNDAQMR